MTLEDDLWQLFFQLSVPCLKSVQIRNIRSASRTKTWNKFPFTFLSRSSTSPMALQGSCAHAFCVSIKRCLGIWVLHTLSSDTWCVKQNCRAEFERLNLKRGAYVCSLCESSMKSQQWDATGRVQVWRPLGKCWSTDKGEHSLGAHQKSWVSFEHQVRS